MTRGPADPTVREGREIDRAIQRVSDIVLAGDADILIVFWQWAIALSTQRHRQLLDAAWESGYTAGSTTP